MQKWQNVFFCLCKKRKSEAWNFGSFYLKFPKNKFYFSVTFRFYITRTLLFCYFTCLFDFLNVNLIGKSQKDQADIFINFLLLLQKKVAKKNSFAACEYAR